MENKPYKEYNQAIKLFHDYSTGDPTAILAKEHGLIGLTRIIMCMQRLGIDTSHVDFIALPDFTYTRSRLRWNAGFPYGCIIKFHDDDVPFIPVDFRPNCCGVILAELQDFSVSILDIQRKYYDIVNSYSEIDSSDFNRRNHFMGIYKCETNQKYYYLLHGSFNFAKNALYSEKNETLANGVQSMAIMGESFLYLIGSQAQAYYNNYKKYEELTVNYRELITKALFPDAKILFHRTHEGFNGIHTILLGAYADNHPFCCPIMLAPECDLPVVQIDTPILINNSEIYCAPHGGGYALGQISEVEMIDKKIEGDYLLTYSNNCKMLTNNILDMPFYYRTQTERYWCDIYHMANESLRLRPIFNLKV